MKSWILYIIFLSSISCLHGQVSIQHNKTIKHIFVDSLSNVTFIDEHNNLNRLNNLNILPFEENYNRLVVKKPLKRNNSLIVDNKIYTVSHNELNLLNLDPKTYLFNKDKIVEQKNGFITLKSNDEIICQISNESKILDALHYDNKVFILTQDILFNICRSDNINLPFKATSFDVLNNNTILITSERTGIWLLQDDQLKKYYVPGVSFPNTLRSIKIIDRSFWILTQDKTLMHFDLDKQILKRVAVDVNDFELDRWNKLWYASNQNIVSNIHFINDELPLINISKVKINDQTTDHTPSLNINSKDKLQVHYNINYSPHENSKVEYRLRSNGVWKTSSTSPIILSHLTTQTDVLQIRASADHNYFTRPQTLNINVTDRFIDSSWFYIFLGLLALLILLLFSQWRISKENKRLAKDKRALKLKLEVAHKTQKLGQLQLNPHFLFNTMNSINGLIAIDKKSEARKALSKFAKMMRSVLSFSFNEKIKMEEELAFLNDYIQLEQLIREDKFEYEINSEIKNHDIPPMIIQPFVENAIIHGLQHKSTKGHLQISIEDIPHYIKVRIKDDGIGRDAAQKFRKESHNSSAIKIVKDRILNLNKWKTKEPITYIDLKEQSMASGTECILHIPK